MAIEGQTRFGLTVARSTSYPAWSLIMTDSVRCTIGGVAANQALIAVSRSSVRNEKRNQRRFAAWAVSPAGSSCRVHRVLDG